MEMTKIKAFLSRAGAVLYTYYGNFLLRQVKQLALNTWIISAGSNTEQNWEHGIITGM